MNPTKDSQRVADEFFDKLNELAGNHAIALVGVAMSLDVIEARAADVNVTDESMNLVGYGDPNTDEGFFWQAWPLKTMVERLGPDGPVVRSIGQQWVVSVAAQWNENYRQQFADAEGLADKNEIKEPIMADLNRMRNDILKHRGIATRRNTGRCEQLKWFEPGDPIHVMPVHIVEVMDTYGLVHPAKDFDGRGTWEF
jgi:hypothetical protein